MKKYFVLLFSLLPPGFVAVLWLANRQPFSYLHAAGVFLVSISALAIPELLWIRARGQSLRRVEIAGLTLLLVGGILFFFITDSFAGVGAYLGLSVFAAICLLSVEILTLRLRMLLSWAAAAALALYFGAIVLGSLQVIERFSEEEFFAAVQWVLLSGWWLMLYIAWRAIAHPEKRQHRFDRHPLRPILLVSLAVSLFMAPVILIMQYQASFFPEQVDIYPGINAENPFLCGEVGPKASDTVYDSGQIFQDITTMAAANPDKPVPLLGMLSLFTSDHQWKEAFREGLLREARQGQYTGAAGSVKYGQYETSLRVYYFHQVSLENPQLFTADETYEILRWFNAVNRRSMTVEWVDWMYAAAFGEWPRGPYLNQENGAGLLALLEAYGYADSQLSDQNRAFLAEHNFGWNQRFRNTDDSVWYQTLWINNAFFQSIYSGNRPQDRIQKAFLWMLLQATPDGSPYGYNPHLASLAESTYLGAQLTGDGRYLWLSGRSLDYLRLHNLPVYDQPGLREPVHLTSVQPELGSCLIYGDSGTPVRLGPLAPDKIVFREGWKSDDRYLNLNLRFTGWHRYKATNSVISVYQDEPLIYEQIDAPSATWLPVGRSMFRDKRIPRENLNGLVIPRRGLSKLVFWLTGFGSPWAQDPPFYAEVERFETMPDMDVSVTRMEWNDWTHVRSIYFVHDGPTIVLDEAAGPKAQTAGVTWHAISLPDFQRRDELSVMLGAKGNVEMRLVEIEQGNLAYENELFGGERGLKLLFTGVRTGSLRLATVFLDGEWKKAKIQKEEDFLLIQRADRSVKIPLLRVNK